MIYDEDIQAMKDIVDVTMYPAAISINSGI